MTGWQVYWLLQLDSIKNVLFWAWTIPFLSILLLCAVSEGAAWKPLKGWLFPSYLLLALGIMISSFIPSTKTMAAIYLVPRIASAQNLDQLGKDGGEIYNLAVTRLKQALGEAK